MTCFFYWLLNRGGRGDRGGRGGRGGRGDREGGGPEGPRVFIGNLNSKPYSDKGTAVFEAFESGMPGFLSGMSGLSGRCAALAARIFMGPIPKWHDRPSDSMDSL